MIKKLQKKHIRVIGIVFFIIVFAHTTWIKEKHSGDNIEGRLEDQLIKKLQKLSFGQLKKEDIVLMRKSRRSIGDNPTKTGLREASLPYDTTDKRVIVDIHWLYMNDSVETLRIIELDTLRVE